MKRYRITAVWLIAFMLIISGFAYAQGAQQQTRQQSMEMVNVNIATQEELQRVPGMDQSLAQSIIQHRQTNGPFQSVDDLAQVQGMDEQKLKGMKGHLTAEKININTVKAEDLQKVREWIRLWRRASFSTATPTGLSSLWMT